MGRPKTKESQKVEVRERILNAARSVVASEGFGALTMRKIAEAIDCAPATIYLYFENREAIARELCLRGFQELLEFMEPAAAVGDPLKRLAALLEAYARFGMTHPETYRLGFMADPKLAEAVFREAPIDAPGTGGLRAFGFLLEALRELKAQGKLAKTANVTELAEVLWASIHGVVSLKLTYPSFPETPADRLAAAVTRVALDGLPRPKR